jgi:hypothetical protein
VPHTIADGGAGDVHLVDTAVPGEVGTDGGVAVDDPDHAGLDQGREGRAVHPEQAGERRVELHERGAVVGDELVERVQRRDGRHVAGAEHQPDAAVLAHSAGPQARLGAHLPLRDARRHPHLSLEAVEQDPLLDGAR